MSPTWDDDLLEIRVVCAAGCGRTGTFVISDDEVAALRNELAGDPWRCLYHDFEWRWHTKRTDREEAQKIESRGNLAPSEMTDGFLENFRAIQAQERQGRT